MPPSIRSFTPYSVDGTSGSFSVPAGSAIGDLLVLLHGQDDDGITGLSVSGGTDYTDFVMAAERGAGASDSGIRILRRKIKSTGAQSIGIATTSSNVQLALAVVIADADDIVASSVYSTTGATSINLPSIDVPGPDHLLLVGTVDEVAVSWPDPPSGMALLHRFAGPSGSAAMFHQSLVSGGATGNRIATQSGGSSSTGHAAAMFAVSPIASSLPTKKKGQFAALFPGGI